MKYSIKNKKSVIMLVIIGAIALFFGLDMAFFKPTVLNKYIATKLYKTPAHTSFVDANFYSCIIDEYNANVTNESEKLAYSSKISDAKLQEITKLTCSGKGITTIKGIEKLTNLEELDLSDNSIAFIGDATFSGMIVPNPYGTTGAQSLNLSPGSYVNNTYINKISSAISEQTTTTTYSDDDDIIIEIDERSTLQYNVKLKKIDISNNQLSNVYLLNNVVLEELNLSGNRLTTVVLSNNTNLLNLNLFNNELKTLDIKTNKLLKEVNVASNYLESLDISKNNNIITLNASNNSRLKTVTMSTPENNTLKELNLSNGLLNSITNLDKYISLEKLNLSSRGNSFTTIDLSKNTELKFLDLSYNSKLENINLNNNTKLEELNLSFCNLDKDSVNLDKYVNLKKLDLSYNENLTNVSIANNKALTTLLLTDTGLTKIDLSNNTNLKRLRLSNNSLTNIDLSKNPQLEQLDLGNNKLTTVDFKNNTNLITVNVSNNLLQKLDISMLSKLSGIDMMGNNYSVSQNIYLGDTSELLSAVKFPKHFPKTNYEYHYEISNPSVLEMKGNKINAKVSDIVTINVEVWQNLVTGNTPTTPIPTTRNYVTTVVEKIMVYEETIKVNIFQLWSYKFKINNEHNYIYVHNASSADAVTENITTSYEQHEDVVYYEIVDPNTNQYKLQQEVDGEIKDFKVFNLVGFWAHQEVLNGIRQGYIYTGTNKFDLSAIGTQNCVAKIVNNELLIENAYEVFEKVKLISISSEKYKNLTDGIYIGENELNLDDFVVTNGYAEVIEDEIYIYNENGIDLGTIPIIKISSTKYDLNKDYIYLPLEQFDINDITISNGTVKLENNKLKILNDKGTEIDSIDIISVNSSKYKEYLDENYIYVGQKDFNEGSIVVTNGIKEYKDNKLNIKFNDKVIYTYNIIGIDLKNLKVDHNNIYVAKDISYNDFIKNIKTTGVSYKLYDDTSEVTNGTITSDLVLKFYVEDELVDLYSIVIELFDSGQLIVDNNTQLVKRLPQGSTVKTLKETITVDGTINVEDNQGAVQEEQALSKTGQKLIIELPENTYTYNLVVTGDVTGDGLIDINDVAKSYNYQREEIQMEKYYKAAADVVDEDDDINIYDVSKLYNFVRGDITSLGE